MSIVDREVSTNLDTSEEKIRRRAVKIWCDPEWIEWLAGFARYENMTLPGVTAAALIRLAMAQGINTCESLTKQVRPTNHPHVIVLPRGHYAFYYWPSARAWIKTLASSLGESVGSVIERALMEHAQSLDYSLPPPRTSVRRCVPRI
jgi:hypothetical protein